MKTELFKKCLNKIQKSYKVSFICNETAVKESIGEKVKSNLNLMHNRYHILEAIQWLKRAQDFNSDRGISRGYSVGWNDFYKSFGWQPSYPETTGYIIPTFFDCAEYFQDQDLRIRAIEMADWEIDVQLKNGAVMGGTIDYPPTPAIFNTGQVMLGFMRTYKETMNEKYREASEKAARFLVMTQEEEGNWQKWNSVYANTNTTTYNSRVGWALILQGKYTNNNIYIHAGEKSVKYAISQQNGNGWFKSNCLNDPENPLLHTICYAIEGLLGAYYELSNSEYLKCVILPVDRLIDRIQDDGNISGRFDANWNGTVKWNCLSGSAQLACILLSLLSITGEPKYQVAARKLLKFLKSTQNCSTNHEGLRGGIKGSYPFGGEYGRYQTLSWATKFYIDALLLDEKLMG
jgi:hypothetical protein